MKRSPPGTPDVMQVCRNGHVITDLLHTFPERGLAYCDRCAAPTIDRCPTCGARLLGATFVPGLVPLGSLSAPACCFACGAPFPWAHSTTPLPAQDAIAGLEEFLRRVPRTIRQLRKRHGDRPPFVVRDEHDLEDLLRAILPLEYDEVRRESRTPSYASATRFDIRLGKEEGSVALALTVKVVDRSLSESALQTQWQEDIAHYARARDCRAVVALVYDPELLLTNPARVEKMMSHYEGELQVGCVIAS